jgi:chromate transporter
MSVFLDTMNIVSIAFILAICVEIGRSAITDWWTVIIAIIGLGTTMAFPKLNSAFVVLGVAVLGYLLWMI